MKIEKITLQNINSLSSPKPITIDFTKDRFRESGVFLITGVTGAGKSSILDAITLALYYKVPRLTADSSLADIVNSGSSTALAIVEFKVKDVIYEASWTIRVLTKSGKRLKNPKESVRLKNLSSGYILAEKKRDIVSKIEEIINLNYKQFLRAVLLAQGEFSAFLSASSKDKGILLEQITGEDIYKKIGIKLRDKISSQNRLLDSLKNRINSEDLLTKDIKDRLNSKLQDIEIRLKEIDRVQKEIDSLKSLKIEKESELKYYNLSIKKLELNSSSFNSRYLTKKELLELKKKKLIEKKSRKRELKEIEDKLTLFNIEELEKKYSSIEDTIDRYYKYKNSLLERDKLNKNLESIKSKIDKITPNIDIKRDKLKRLEESLNHKEEVYILKLQISSLKKERDRLKRGKECPLCGSTSHPKIEDYKKIEPTILEKEINCLKRDIKDLNITIDSLDKKLIEYKINRANLEKNILNIESSLEYIDIDVEEYELIKKSIKRDILEYRRLEQNEKKILRLNLDNTILGIDRRVELYDLLDKKETILKRVEELREKIFLKNELKLMESKKELLEIKGSIEERFKQDRSLRERNESRIKEVEKEEIRLFNLKRLLKILGGTVDSFNIYVQRLTLIELITLANIHLKKFAPRYELRIYSYKNEKEALKFGLVDCYQANILREIDTSSGGEKFIISLALALGLSDLASKNVKIESLFIDEGFGTLDSRSLDIVISTLESLKAKDKLIGIISHVDSLKSRIPTQINITKMGNGVSEVRII